MGEEEMVCSSLVGLDAAMVPGRGYEEGLT
jgi:hypothetical protein